MAFTSGKKGTNKIPMDPRNRCDAHPNPGGGGGPPSDPSPPLQARWGRQEHRPRCPLGWCCFSCCWGGDVGLGGSLAAASVPASAAVLPAVFPLHPRGGRSSSVIDLRSPINADTDEGDAAAAAFWYWTTTQNPLLTMEVIAREDGEDNYGEFSDALVTSAITHCLKKNTSLRDLSFTPQQLEDLLGPLIENRRELLEFAIRADSHRPSRAVQLAPQLGEALPVKLPKKLKNKEGMADRLAEIYFIWREVALCPEVSTSLPHVRTKLGSALEDFTLSLVRVHTFCRVELEVERNTTKALRSEKIYGELLFALEFCFNHSFVGNTFFFLLIFIFITI